MIGSTETRRAIVINLWLSRILLWGSLLIAIVSRYAYHVSHWPMIFLSIVGAISFYYFINKLDKHDKEVL